MERYPGELDTLRVDNIRLRRLLELTEQQARAADPDQTETIATRSATGVPLMLAGTGSLIGEGFDCPVLDTLFLAAPITFTPVLASALHKRASGYVGLGFRHPRKTYGRQSVTPDARNTTDATATIE